VDNSLLQTPLGPKVSRQNRLHNISCYVAFGTKQNIQQNVTIQVYIKYEFGRGIESFFLVLCNHTDKSNHIHDHGTAMGKLHGEKLSAILPSHPCDCLLVILPPSFT